jgi:amino acid transporter
MAANIRGARLGAGIVNAATGAKVLALMLLLGAAFALGGGHGATVAHLTAPATAPVTWSGFGLGIISVLFAYDGFADVSLIAGEVSRPERTIPLAVIAGTLGIIVIYVAANVVYVYVLPLEVIQRSPLVAADTLFAILGSSGARLVSALVALSTFSALMAVVLASPRVFFAMAHDGLLFSRLASVHRKYGTPYAAIGLTGALGIVFLASQTFEQLAETSVLALWPFYALTVGALYRLRRLRPDLPRPYKAAGYPIVPGLFILAVVIVVVNAVIAQPIYTLVTFAVLLAGLPVYTIVRRTSR